MTRRTPWFVWLAAVSVLSTVIGIQWDIAWHRSNGRDTFWSPPHMAIYAGGIIAGLMAAAIIFRRTFSRGAALDSPAVRMWGFSGPLGAFIAAWGGAAMLVSAPFDDWWHGAYGLDVKILSPPHTVLALGIFAVLTGAMLLMLGWLNREATRGGRALFVMTAGLLLAAIMTFEMEYIWRAAQHSGVFYRVVMTVAPGTLIALGAASGLRWGATAVAAAYSVFWLALLWIFPLVPATPKLGPVFHQVTHLIPAGFPLLFVVPAFLALDLARDRAPAVLRGVLFLGIFAVVQWPFSSFLMTPGARNAVFGTQYFDFSTRPEGPEMQNRFFDLDGSPEVWRREWLLALALAAVTAGIGALVGRWLKAVRR